MKSKHLVIRVDPEDKKRIKQLALDNDITIKQLLLDAVKEYRLLREKKNEEV